METITKEFSEELYEEKPCLYMVAGPNGSGKSTLFKNLTKKHSLPFINADEILKVFGNGAPSPEKLAQRISETARIHFIEHMESFATETVFSDQVESKLSMMREAQAKGFKIILFYVAISSPELSYHRVQQRVKDGGHDVPTNKLVRRFNQSLQNLKESIDFADQVTVLENSTIENPYRTIFTSEHGDVKYRDNQIPSYLDEYLKS